MYISGFNDDVVMFPVLRKGHVVANAWVTSTRTVHGSA